MDDLAPPFFRLPFRPLRQDPTYSGPGAAHPRREFKIVERVVSRPGCPPELLEEWLRHNQPTTAPEPVLTLPPPVKKGEGIKPPRRGGVPHNETSNMGAIRVILATCPGLTAGEVLAKLREADSARFAKTKAANIASWLAESRARPKPRVRSEKSPEGVRWWLIVDGEG